MALIYAEPCLVPLGNTFQEWDEQPCAQKRRHSYPRYAPHHLLQLSLDDLVSAFSEDDSTTAAGSPTSQAPSSLGEHEQADSLDEESSPELWPDTDNDDDIYEWSPCSRRRVVEVDSTTAARSPTPQAPSWADLVDEESSPELWPDTDTDDDIYELSPCSRRGVEAPFLDETGGGCHACQATVCIPAASEDDATTTPGSLTSQAPSILGDHDQVDSLDDEVNALRGAQRGEAQHRYQTQRKKQQRQAKKKIRREEARAGAAEPSQFIVSP
jgi:hypothetical protein